MEATDNTSWLRGLIPSAAGPRADPHLTTDERQPYNWTGTGISIGAGVGMAIGVAIGGGAGMAIGIAIGAGVGVVVGSAIDGQRSRRDR